MGIQSCKFRKPDILDGRPQLQPHLLPGAPIRVCGSQCECSWAWHQGICWREQEPNSPGLNLSYCVTSGKSFYRSEPVSSPGTSLKAALWGVQEMLYVKRKMQYRVHSK